MADSYRLPNGITVVCENRPQSGKVEMVVAIKAGSINEELAENGLTNLVQEACFGGTPTRTRSQIAADIEDRGGSFGYQATRETTDFAATALTRDAADIFAVLSDVIRNPSFAPDELAKTKPQIIQNIAANEQNPQYRASKRFMTALFGGHPAAQPVKGDAALVESFTPQQVKDRHAAMLSDPSKIVLSFAGDIDMQTAIALAEEHYGDMVATPQKPHIPLTFTGGIDHEANNDKQLALRLGFEAPSNTDPERYAYLMLSQLLSGGMSSPLFTEIRGKRSLVYSVGASYGPMTDTGSFYIAAGTSEGKVGELIEAAMDIFGNIIQNGFSDEELTTARRQIMRERQGASEQASQVAIAHSSHILTVGRLVPLEEFEEKLKRVTADDIRRACATMMGSGKFALASAGPQETMPDEQAVKAMMKKQVAGVTVPPAPPRSLQPTFTRRAAAQAETETSTNIRSTTLANGLTVVTAERPGTLACGAWVGAGSSHETPALSGATHMNEHMMFRGTPSYGAGTIPAIIEGELYGGLNAFTSKDRTAYYFYHLAPDGLGKAIDICGEMVFQANIDEDEYGHPYKDPKTGLDQSTGERGVVLEEIRGYDLQVGRRVQNQLFALAYPNQAHGRPVLGTVESLLATEAKDLRAYRDDYYAPNNVVFVAAGPVKHEDFVALIESKFGHLKPAHTEALETPVYQGGTNVIEMDQAQQLCNFVIGAESVAQDDPDFHAYGALAMMLGSGQSSRLYDELVSRRGMTGDVGAGHAGFRNAGLFIIGGAVAPEKTKPLMNAIYQETRALIASPSQAELDKVKARIEMGLLQMTETSNGTCRFFGDNTLLYGEPKTPEDALAAVRALTLEDIKRVGAKILQSNPTLSMVVKPGTDRRLLPMQQDMIAMRDGTYRAEPATAPSRAAAATPA